MEEKNNNNTAYIDGLPASYEGEERYIFVSYCHKDRNIILPIIQNLISEGYRIWYDRSIEATKEFDDVISSHIKNSDLFIAFFSHEYFKSDYCDDEVYYARKLGKKILKIHIDNTQNELPSKYDMRLGKYQDLYLFQYNSIPFFIEELKKTEGFSDFSDNLHLSGKTAFDFFERLRAGKVTEKECASIKGLNLKDCWIKSLPKNIGMLKNLQTLCLASNTLKRLPPEFAQLVNLNELDLSSNSFRELPLVLTKLPSLISLNIGGNHINVLPKEIGSFQCLESLDIYRNWFSIIPPELGRISTLKRLDISYNQFQFLPKQFFRLKNLEKLDLNSTDLKTLPEDIINFENLITLDLSYNYLTDPLPFHAIISWLNKGIQFEQEETNYNKIMQNKGINLFETEIYDFSTNVLLSNNQGKITEYYKSKGFIE